MGVPTAEFSSTVRFIAVSTGASFTSITRMVAVEDTVVPGVPWGGGRGGGDKRKQHKAHSHSHTETRR
jgi:hypothetical protein